MIASARHDLDSEPEYSWRPLNVVAQPIAEMARVAVSLALDLARSTPSAQFPGTLVVGRSCGCPTR